MAQRTLVAVLSLLIVVAAAPRVQNRPDIEKRTRDLLLVDYHHGFPYAEVHALGRPAIPYIKAMLSSEANKKHWPNLVTAIGVISRESSFPYLRSLLLERFSGTVDEETFRTLASVPFSMGVLRTSDSLQIRDLLTRGADPAFWQRLQWQTVHFRDRGSLEYYFSKQCINALGYSGSPSVGRTLEGMRARPRDPRQRLVIESAIRTNDQISHLGLEAYFRAGERAR
jgi:hypothetical protein